MTTARIVIPSEQIADFARRWRVTELSLFGSVLRNDFRPDSDIDMLVTFEEDAAWTLFDIVTMQDELEDMFGRKVDLGERRWVERSQNYVRRKAILNSLEPIYASR
ncbi:MAG: nucleotidyltransferase family protein [Chloroflexi bacterium]|nr:nucleotidyltransferase family protein [Chloroflexota bacterium]